VLITNVTTPDSGGTVVAVRIDESTVSEVGKGLVPRAGEEVVDGRGGLLTESLVATHAHLDKA